MVHSIKREVYQKTLWTSSYLSLTFSVLPCINFGAESPFCTGCKPPEDEIDEQLWEHMFGGEGCCVTWLTFWESLHPVCSPPSSLGFLLTTCLCLYHSLLSSLEKKENKYFRALKSLLVRDDVKSLVEKHFEHTKIDLGIYLSGG